MRKIGLLYDFIEKSDFYTSPVKFAKDRSVCNIPFVTPSKELDAKFVKEADALGFKEYQGSQICWWHACFPFTMPFHAKVSWI